MPNPRGINQYTKGGGKGGSKKAPSLSAGKKKVAKAGLSGNLKNTRSRGKQVPRMFGGSKRNASN